MRDERIGGTGTKEVKWPHMYKHILLPTDGSELSRKAIDHGIALAGSVKAKVTALIVSTPLDSLMVDPTAAAGLLEQYRALVTSQTAKHLGIVQDAAIRAGVPCDVAQIENDHPYEAIIETAKNRGCDLIVMASHGLRGISQTMLGSQTLKVLTTTTVPVLVVR